MIKKSFLVILSAFIALSVISCGGNKTKTTDNTKDTVKTAKKDTVKINQKFTDIAKILGGMSVDEKSEFYAVTQDKSFISYKTSMDSSFARMGRKRLANITSWSATEIADLNKDLKTVFYPFSGPDYLHVNTFFPHAKKYIMFGLEPVGEVPDLSKIGKDKYAKLFNELNNSIADVLNLSFFKTIDMNVEFNTELLKGSLPVVLLFIARTGHEIIDIKPFELDTAGKIVYLKEFKNLKGEASYNHGAEVTFVEKGKTEIKTVEYFSLNVIDAAIAKNSNSRNYLNSIDANCVTMLKSASYLMHNTYFATIRNLVFSKSKAILQDDSGIAYKFIDKTKWNVQLYGTYNGPIDMFANRFEKDLKKAYEEEKIKTVPFHYGYGNSTALTLMRKK